MSEDVLSRFNRIPLARRRPHGGIELRKTPDGKIICQAGRSGEICIALLLLAAFVKFLILGIHHRPWSYMNYMYVATSLGELAAFADFIKLLRSDHTLFVVDPSGRRVTIYPETPRRSSSEEIAVDDIKLFVAYGWLGQSTYVVLNDGTVYTMGSRDIKPTLTLSYIYDNPMIFVTKFKGFTGKRNVLRMPEKGKVSDADELMRSAAAVLYDPNTSELPKRLR